MTWWDGLSGQTILKECAQVNATKNSGEGSLITTAEGLEFSGKKAQRAVIPWSEITDMRVTTSETSRVTMGRVLTIGVFALAAKKKEQFTILEIETQFSTFAFMSTQSQASVIDLMRPLMAGLRGASHASGPHVALNANPSGTAGPAAQTVAEQIRELGALRDEGLLTDDEFTEKKARLLGS
jgi:hypothetical protein